jgi:multidrug efflux pump subunit AcrA (membrane-fusion protein)
VAVTDNEARSFIIHAVPAESLAMSPGMSAQGLLRLTTERQAVVIPRDALIRSPSGRTTVWVLDKSEEPPVARERRVEVGASFGDRVALEEGLEAGETVVVRGNTRLQEGQGVSIQP